MKAILLAGVIAAGMAGVAQSASITNKDAQAYSLLMTESGVRSELAIGAGASVSACNAGCFITMPNGDHEALSGTETIEIVNGKATFK